MRKEHRSEGDKCIKIIGFKVKIDEE